MIRYVQTETKDELKQILDLQRRNLPQSLEDAEQKSEGFLTVKHSLDLLTEMHHRVPHTIAKVHDKVVGYALSMHPDFGEAIEVLKPMFNEIALCEIEKYIVMGQVCIAKNYRKKGVFRSLYTAMKRYVEPEFSSIITEVDAKNTRSLSAHYAIGFKDLRTYHSGGQDWKLIILK